MKKKKGNFISQNCNFITHICVFKSRNSDFFFLTIFLTTSHSSKVFPCNFELTSHNSHIFWSHDFSQLSARSLEIHLTFSETLDVYKECTDKASIILYKYSTPSTFNTHQLFKTRKTRCSCTLGT